MWACEQGGPPTVHVDSNISPTCMEVKKSEHYWCSINNMRHERDFICARAVLWFQKTVVCDTGRLWVFALCVHVYSDCDGGGWGCLPVWDSEQRAGGLWMEQRICIDCFCASELFSRCQSCLYQLRGKLQHLHREAFSFLPFLSIYLFYNGGCMYNLQCHTGFIHTLYQIAKITERQLRKESKTRAKLGLLVRAAYFL